MLPVYYLNFVIFLVYGVLSMLDKNLLFAAMMGM